MSEDQINRAMHQLEIARFEILSEPYPFGLNLFMRSALLKQHGGNPESGLMTYSLFKEIRDTLTEAIRHKGSSVDQYVQVSGRPGSYVKHHKVYDRQGKACLRCRGPIKRISLGGRGTYFCPKCQK